MVFYNTCPIEQLIANHTTPHLTIQHHAIFVRGSINLYFTSVLQYLSQVDTKENAISIRGGIRARDKADKAASNGPRSFDTGGHILGGKSTVRKVTRAQVVRKPTLQEQLEADALRGCTLAQAQSQEDIQAGAEGQPRSSTTALDPCSGAGASLPCSTENATVTVITTDISSSSSGTRCQLCAAAVLERQAALHCCEQLVCC